MPLITSLPLLLAACAPYPEGLRATPAGDGPVVIVDWDAEPLPDIPYPNDLATVVDRHSPTGLRLNVPLAAKTEMERHAREKLNLLSGFGIYSPITVAFDAPLDLDNIAARHTHDDKLGDDQFADDAVFLIDIDPDSPDYLSPVALDVGHGRYPLDVPNPARYFPNDSRDESPTLVFDTVDEDINGNGVLDWGEDTDNDGVLDKPNVYPEGGDPREDLLTWYEKQTNTLIVRPAVPLRERTTYAVVLTERLTDAAGNPVRSPWDFVHHLRQAEALAPLPDALAGLGLGIDDVAFAWTFTTGDVTGELVAVRRGMKGEGPFADIAARYPAHIGEAAKLHEMEGNDETWRLPMPVLIDTITSLGLFDDESTGPLKDNYTAFADSVVGGAFVTPNFFSDLDAGPAPWPEVDDSDDLWLMNTVDGTWSARGERVAFTCSLPKDVPQPAPVVTFGHGYGSSRFDFLGFAWAFNRVGMAACAFDYPGHGPTVKPDDEVIIEALLSSLGLLPFYDHLKDSRYRDLDNDGDKDSGGDQWTADAFHTRDMVRQAAVDHAQFIDALRDCGHGEMTLPDGSTAMSCDWNGDGVPDIGGADNDYFLLGGSLGGINVAVATAIIDEVQASVPVVAGGGLLDVAFRTEIGGAVEAMHGRLMSPLILGYPQDDGSLLITQMVNSVTDMVELPLATVARYPAGGRIEVENLNTGEIREGLVPDDGRFRVGIAADAASAWEKMQLAGIPVDGPVEGQRYPIDDTTLIGDPLVIRLYTADGELVDTIDSFESDVVFQGVTYPAGAPIVAGAEGLGHVRGSPEMRRIGFVFSAILEPGDPIAYGPHLIEEPFEALSGEPRNVLFMPSPGDTIVSVNTEIALPRAAGLLEMEETDDRYGMTVDQFLIDRQVVRGLEEFGPYTCADGSPCLFDADDLDNGTDDFGAPSDEPLRVTMATSSGVSGMRLPYTEPTGSHGFSTPDPSRSFDISTFAALQGATYFLDRGQRIVDDPCLEDGSCSWLPQLPGDDSTAGGSDSGAADTGN
ncbi:MAG: hypothetical protein D6798_20555 [Deltaproteobacteria bacterium]|nr:MAG: hypothetical protein D6798_20555 [Deltaproteobacteria bacterium]